MFTIRKKVKLYFLLTIILILFSIIDKNSSSTILVSGLIAGILLAVLNFLLLSRGWLVLLRVILLFGFASIFIIKYKGVLFPFLSMLLISHFIVILLAFYNNYHSQSLIGGEE